MQSKVWIAEGVVDDLLRLAREDGDRECCGVLAGREATISRAFPAANAARDPGTSYEIAPEELFRLMREMRAAGLALLGIYHSHPEGRNEPSRRDRERAYYPEAAYFIISPAEGAACAVRAFSIREGVATELEILRA